MRTRRGPIYEIFNIKTAAVAHTRVKRLLAPQFDATKRHTCDMAQHKNEIKLKHKTKATEWTLHFQWSTSW